jgi:PIN domain nuclease of toxin-antitoxin system
VILLDTHCLLWFAQGDMRLSSQSREIVANALERTEACASPISFWEISMLTAKDRVRLERPTHAWVDEFCTRSGIIIVPLSPEIAVAAGELPGLHGDPADRILIATARHHKVPLLTADEAILEYAAAGHLETVDARR